MSRASLAACSTLAASAILKNCRAAMSAGQRLIIVEQLVEADSDLHGVMVDMHMMVVCDEGRERGRADFEKLLGNSGFRMERVFITSTQNGIIEAIAK